MLGELLGARYKVIEVLGAGGFGHTYIVEDTQRPGNPRCVLKHLTFASSNPTVLQQVRRLFQAEAETLERLGKHDQIPRLLAYFEENQEFYLVQEFVEGRSLGQELASGVRFSEQQVVLALKDVLGILEFVHSENVIHRDIKPENLIRRQQDGKFVLIDFGAVKTIGTVIAESTGETGLSMPIYTSGYAASEQCLGRPHFSSDLYSLGIVAIQMLTGLRPSQLPVDFNTSEMIWRDQVQVSDGFANFLDRMTRYHYIHRYQSATEALQVLHQAMADVPTQLNQPSRLSQQLPEPSHAAEVLRTQLNDSPVDARQIGAASPSRKRLSRWHKLLLGTGLAATAAVAVVALVHSGRQFPFFPSPTQNGAQSVRQNGLGERISVGERLLNKWQTNTHKQEGVDQFAIGNYSEAVATLEAARRRDRSDPELLIYLNNAQIGNARSYTIAAAVPLGDTFGSALEILRGVAQAQDEVNRAGGIKGVPLKVAIANDDNHPETARQLAESLVNNPTVLGVVGHSTSDTSLAAAQIYQQRQLVMVTPLSSAVQLSNIGNHIFRTMPSDRLSAKALANHLLNRLKKRKVVVFFNSASAYSTSLKTEFKNALFYNGVELQDEIDFSRPDFDAFESVEKAVTRGAEAIMLASDSEVSDRALLVVKMNRGRLKLLTGDSLATSKLLKVAGKEAVGMVLAVPANLTGETPFHKQASQIWGKTADITWRTALAYDATKALIAGLQREPTRSGIQRTLAQPNFSTAGAQGNIMFMPTGDRQGNAYLITVTPITTGIFQGYTFKPL
jgi:ABC-type branched-subunit amino acid transport system substrate-binding protein/predicted Ser/Thr protein kinase